MLEKIRRCLVNKSFLIGILFLLSLLSFIFTPLHLDLRVMLASANQVQYYDGNLLSGVFNTWEIKGVFNRLFIYVLYKIANIFIPYASSIIYEAVVKFIFAIFTILMTSLSVKLVTEKFCINPILLLCIAYFTAFLNTNIQSEMIIVIFLLFAFSLCVNAKMTYKYVFGKFFISGLVIGSIFLFKSVDILMAFPFGASFLIWANINKKSVSLKEVFVIISGVLSMFLIGLIMILQLNPYEIQNMLNASIYEETLFSSSGIVFLCRLKKYFIKYFLYTSIIIPVISIGIITAFKNLINNLKKRDYYNLILSLIIWSFPALIIILTNRYFYYHYFLFVYPSIFEIFISYKDIVEDLKTKLIKYEYWLVFVVILISYLCIRLFKIYPENINHITNFCGTYFLITIVLNCTKLKEIKPYINIKIPLVFVSIIYLGYVSIFSNNFYNWLKSLNKMYVINQANISNLDIKNEESVLYLANGVITYLIGKKSYFREHYPLSIQRIGENSKFVNSKLHIDAMNNVLNYDGKYIFLYEKWFFKNGEHISIKQKIKNNYDYIGDIKIFDVNLNIFRNPKKSEFKNVKIYKKK